MRTLYSLYIDWFFPDFFVSISFCLNSGRFERSLDFLLSMEELYSLPEGDKSGAVAILTRVRSEHFDCGPAQRLSTASQVS